MNDILELAKLGLKTEEDDIETSESADTGELEELSLENINFNPNLEELEEDVYYEDETNNDEDEDEDEDYDEDGIFNPIKNKIESKPFLNIKSRKSIILLSTLSIVGLTGILNSDMFMMLNADKPLDIKPSEITSLNIRKIKNKQDELDGYNFGEGSYSGGDGLEGFDLSGLNVDADKAIMMYRDLLNNDPSVFEGTNLPENGITWIKKYAGEIMYKYLKWGLMPSVSISMLRGESGFPPYERAEVARNANNPYNMVPCGPITDTYVDSVMGRTWARFSDEREGVIAHGYFLYEWNDLYINAGLRDAKNAQQQITVIAKSGYCEGGWESYYYKIYTMLCEPNDTERFDKYAQDVIKKCSDYKPSGGSSGSSGGSAQASGKAKKVIDEAFKYIGVPYVWGGIDPSGFDCSGYMMYIYNRTLGIQLPRLTYDQCNVGTRVNKAQLQPADLVFFTDEGRGPEHVGMYIGNGEIIHAPTFGQNVMVEKLDYMSNFLYGARVIK